MTKLTDPNEMAVRATQLIDSQKGGTVTRGGQSYRGRKGYVVALGAPFAATRTVGEFAHDLEIAWLVRDFAAEYGYMFNDHYLLGVWLEDGELYLDVVEVIETRSAAVALGRARDQIAIWDLAKSEIIETGGTGLVQTD